MVQRKSQTAISRVRAEHVSSVNAWNIGNRIRDNAAPEAKLMTDESAVYAKLGRTYHREIVKHNDKEWFRGDVTTNAIENFWSLFKRGLIGQCHKISVKHLDRYLNEFCFRFNNRDNEELSAFTVGCLVLGIPLPYAKLIATEGSISEPKTPSPGEPF
jgi:hypothetical protein